MPDAFIDSVETRERKRVEHLGFAEDLDIDQITAEATSLPPPRVARGLIWDNDLPTALTAPLFYDQPLVFLCPHCQLASEPNLLKWMGDRELIVPVMQACYHAFPRETVAALNGIPHISPFALFEIAQGWARGEELGCLCASCTQRDIVAYGHLPPEDQKLVENYLIPRLTELPQTVRTDYFPTINDLIQRADSQGLQSEARRVQRLVMLNQSRSLKAIPQFQLSGEGEQATVLSSDNSELLALTLGVSYSPEIPPQDYLEIISAYRGSLSSLLGAEGEASLQEALDRVDTINTEIGEIRESKRARLLRLGTKVFRRDRRKILEGLVSGAIGTLAGGPLGGAIAVGAVQVADLGVEAFSESLTDTTRRRIADRAVAAFYGKSLAAVQVWHLQESLPRRRVATARRR